MVPVSAVGSNRQLTMPPETVVPALLVVLRTLKLTPPAEEPVQVNTRSLLVSIEKVPLGSTGEVATSDVGATMLAVNTGMSAPAAANVIVSPPAKMSLSLGTAGIALYTMVPGSYATENVGTVPPMVMLP